MTINVRNNIIERLRATKRENIETVIEYMNEHGFFTRHCHSHHRYYGGLADHAWQTYQAALKFYDQNITKQPLNKDSIAIATLLHDFCNCTGMHHIHGHSRRSAQMLKDLGFHLSAEEFIAIRFHMGVHNKKTHFLYANAVRSQLRYITTKADRHSAGKKKGWG